MEQKKSTAKKAASADEIQEKRQEIREENYSSKVFWAFFWIFIGTLLLLTTLGIVKSQIWLELLRFWPVFIIIAGLELIFGKSKWAGLIMSGFFILLCSGLLLLTANNGSFFGSGEMVTTNKDLAAEYADNFSSREITVNIGAARYDLSDSGSGQYYLQTQAEHAKNFGVPQLTSSTNGRKLLINYQQEQNFNLFSLGNTQTKYDIIIGSPLLETDLNLNIGAGESFVTLNNLTTGKINAKVGAGSMVISLGSDSVPSELNFEVGAGDLQLNLPEEVGYKISYEVGMGNINIDGHDFGGIAAKDENVYSDNYQQAVIKLVINAKIGMGQANIHYINYRMIP